ncbi:MULTISPECIES: SDR family oxidoreductase [Arsenicicoccus]|uniref:SDR family oxidoreductase n=1 Tax=Arsenicicoccus bolidensis TaxID=229480 RepID=A0ABS9Q5C8_9MICO|nr:MULTISPECIES: SDR family oxidoreductase [Arsenicicoccus]MCG7323087.1 SDR family oxidoreductase [Arsenicicoccus bolidensis]
MTPTLRGRTCLVTGAAGPLGSVLADALATEGATVIAVDLHAQGVAASTEQLPTPCDQTHQALAADLLTRDGLDAAESAARSAGSLDVLVNNAAFTGTSGVPGYAVPFEEQTDDAFELALRLNLTAPFSLARRLAPMMCASGHGSIINVSSIYGLVGPNMGLYAGTRMGNPAAYAVSKGGVAQLTRYLATVLAPDIRVNAFAPGGIARGQDDAFTRRYESLTPLGRMGSEDDFRGVVTWLAGDASAYVTGQVIAVDGGWTAW